MNKKIIVVLIIIIFLLIITFFKIRKNNKEDIYQIPIEEMINIKEYEIVEEYINSLYKGKEMKFDIRAISNQGNEFIVKIMEYIVRENKETSTYVLLNKFENIVSTYKSIDYEKDNLEEKFKIDAIKNEKDMNMKQIIIVLKDNKNPQIIEEINL